MCTALFIYLVQNAYLHIRRGGGGGGHEFFIYIFFGFGIFFDKVEIRSEQFENWYFSRGSITPELMAFFLFLKKKKILIFIICLELSIYRLDCTDADLGLLGPDLWKLFKVLFIWVSTKIGEPFLFSYIWYQTSLRWPKSKEAKARIWSKCESATLGKILVMHLVQFAH